MLSQIHETHSYSSPLLPFIFHRDMRPSPLYGMVNWHTNIELLYVRSGQGFVLYEGEEIPMREGDTVIVNTNCLHSFRADPAAANDAPIFSYDCLIIDEAHERTLNIDFLLGVIRNLLPKRQDLKVAISSATLDLARFSEFFHNAPVIEVAGRTFPVEDIFLPPSS